MKYMNQAKKFGRVVVLGASTLAMNAYAEVPAGVTTAITDGTADVKTIGAAILLIVVAIVGFVWLKRVIK